MRTWQVFGTLLSILVLHVRYVLCEEKIMEMLYLVIGKK
jgi:hypothetical protein